MNEMKLRLRRLEALVAQEGGDLTPGCTVIDKAEGDPFMYVLKLVTGEVIHFAELTRMPGGWVHLSEIREHAGFTEKFTFDRGLDVRLKSIVWISDADGYDS